MKVLLLNGSPHKNGCTFTALSEVAAELEKYGIETSFFHIGVQPVHGCVGCKTCYNTGRCTFDNDFANEILRLLLESDGLVIGSPVYFAGPSGALCALLDRVFYCAYGKLAHKVGACIVNCRRGGASSAFERLNKYFTASNMPVASSQYWNSTHGLTPDDVRQDLEGLQTLRVLAADMAFLIKSMHQATSLKPKPEPERFITNFTGLPRP